MPNISNVATVGPVRATPGMIGLIGLWDSLDGDVEASLLHNIVEHEIPIIAPVMGRAMKSTSSQRTVPLRAGYDAEAWEMCHFLLERLHLVWIACSGSVARCCLVRHTSRNNPKSSRPS